jgi:hypothetical protein
MDETWSRYAFHAWAVLPCRGSLGRARNVVRKALDAPSGQGCVERRVNAALARRAGRSAVAGDLVVNHCHRDERLHQTVRIALAASTPGGPLVETLATEIDAVRTSRHFYGYRESNILAQELDSIREGITKYLLPAQPRAAAELFGRLIRLDANVYERSDDSDGVIGDAIGEAVTDCGRAWAAVPERDPKILAAEVFDLFTTDEYGARSEVIIAFSEALGTSGLNELELLVRERLGHAPAGKYGYRQQALTTALENIADARGDVDGYIAAQRLAGTGVWS